MNKILLKFFLVIGTLFVGYYSFISYIIYGSNYAQKICHEALEEHYKGEIPFNQPSIYGVDKSWYQKRECIDKMFPIPWISKPELTGNLPRFISK